uniref:Cysteine and glycine-rich protein 3 n=1 Tax=Magallana gigas TaxID=29159 RepID=K1QML1_MAGGI
MQATVLWWAFEAHYGWLREHSPSRMSSSAPWYTSSLPSSFFSLIWRFLGGGEKCGICSKSVYAAERIEAGGTPFHKLCFKCSECKMSLKLNTYAQADGILYCKKHYQEIVVAKNTQTPVL